MSKKMDLLEIRDKVKETIDDFGLEPIGVTLSVIVKQEDYKKISFSNYDNDPSIIAYRSVRVEGTRWVVQIMGDELPNKSS